MVGYAAGFEAASKGTPYLEAYKPHAGLHCLVGIAPQRHAEHLWGFFLGYRAGMTAIASNARVARALAMNTSAHTWMAEQSREALEANKSSAREEVTMHIAASFTERDGQLRRLCDNKWEDMNNLAGSADSLCARSICQACKNRVHERKEGIICTE